MTEKLYDYQRCIVPTEGVQEVVDGIDNKIDELLRKERALPNSLRPLHDFRMDTEILTAYQQGVLAGAGFIRRVEVIMPTGEVYDFTPRNNGVGESVSIPGGLADKIRGEVRPEDFNA